MELSHRRVETAPSNLILALHMEKQSHTNVIMATQQLPAKNVNASQMVCGMEPLVQTANVCQQIKILM